MRAPPTTPLLRPARSARRGAAAVTVLLAVMVLLILTGAVLMANLGSFRERSSALDEFAALTAADSGVSHAIVAVLGEELDPIGSAERPVRLASGAYWATIADEGDEVYTIRSFGRAGVETAALEVVVSLQRSDPFQHAIFAGNGEEDALFQLELGGVGTAADEISGNVYSGGDIVVTGDAAVTGTLAARGAVEGALGLEGKDLPPPDFAAVDYASEADFVVGDLFAGATLETNDTGGEAWQVPESNPAHIFRKNPSNRTRETDLTPKDDYFLEDPYEGLNTETTIEGDTANAISLSGVNGKPGPDGNRALYYIDGNLWLHNTKTLSLEFRSDTDGGTQVTFIVKGNIYFSDNLFYEDQDLDGTAFIALEDPAVVDSGNIYLGDPRFGTLGRMQSFLYAERNVFDISLDPASSVRIDGNLAAGDKIQIDRNFLASAAGGTGDGDWGWWYASDPALGVDDGWWEHDPDATPPAVLFERTRLTVNYDDRLVRDLLPLPGLPERNEAYTVLSWREVAAP